jgi:crotonobetainyl-CoA:carnitine CoA-transferase CaiB-like acyl-CoA transferase
VPNVADTGEGGLYLQMNRNKRCLTLDLASDDGRRIVRELVAGADVIVANLPPATLRNLGLDWDTVSALNPRAVLTVATAYGSVGPYSPLPGFDSVGQAMSGAMYMSGLPDAPVRATVNYVDVSTAQACAMGTLAALWMRERTGRGQLVEGSLLRSGLIHTNSILIEQAVRAPDRACRKATVVTWPRRATCFEPAPAGWWCSRWGRRCSSAGATWWAASASRLSRSWPPTPCAGRTVPWSAP